MFFYVTLLIKALSLPVTLGCGVMTEEMAVKELLLSLFALAMPLVLTGVDIAVARWGINVGLSSSLECIACFFCSWYLVPCLKLGEAVDAELSSSF